MSKITLINTILLICLCINSSRSQDFQVQLAAYDRAVPNSHFTEWGYHEVQLKKDRYNFFRYSIKGFDTREEAEKLRQEVIKRGFPYARIIDLKAEEALSIQQRQKNFNVEEDLVLEPIYFASGSTSLDQRSKDILKRAKVILEKNPSYTITLEGHSDSSGSAALNVKVSTERARAARKFLEEIGIEAYRLQTAYKGESTPLAINKTKAGEDVPMGRRYNRRVTPLIMNQHGQPVFDLMRKAKIPEHLRIIKNRPQ